MAQNEWKDEFRKQFVCDDGQAVLLEDEVSELESFISSLLHRQRQELTEKVEGMKYVENVSGDYELGKNTGWNDACNEFIKLLKEGEE